MKLQQVSDNCFAVLGHDDLIDPGAEIEISFERLGTLRSRFADPACKLPPSRWPLRPALQRFHGPHVARRRSLGRFIVEPVVSTHPRHPRRRIPRPEAVGQTKATHPNVTTRQQWIVPLPFQGWISGVEC
jgi:hypothetical protein